MQGFPRICKRHPVPTSSVDSFVNVFLGQGLYLCLDSEQYKTQVSVYMSSEDILQMVYS